MLFVLVFVFALVDDEPDVLPLVEPALGLVVPLAEPEVPVPVLPLVLLPGVVPLVAAVEPGCTMAPPLAPRVPVLVAPCPLTVASPDALVPVVAEAPAGVVVEPLVVVCAMAPPASSEATRRLSSLLMRSSF